MLLNRAKEKIDCLKEEGVQDYDLVQELEDDEQKEKEEKMLAKILAEDNPEAGSPRPKNVLYNPLYRRVAENEKKEWASWKLPAKSFMDKPNNHASYDNLKSNLK